jgi:photosystem II stability/assembly factor-like uncharacterized protein
MKKLILPLLLIGAAALAQPSLQVQENDTPTSLRGIAIRENGEWWVSGSNGTLGVSRDNGNTWTWMVVPGFEQAEFRDIELIDSTGVLIMSSVAPAAILYSKDAGKHFETVFISTDTTWFLDGMAMSGKYGICYGDPINNKMCILQSSDYGKTWQYNKDGPLVSEGTAAFAASGSGIQYVNKKSVLLATGGKESSVFYSKNAGTSWERVKDIPFDTTATSGIYGMVVVNQKMSFVIGGDYTKESEQTNNCYYTRDGWKSIQKPTAMPLGYRSAIAVTNQWVIACGSAGVDIANMSDMSFSAFSEIGFHTCIAFKGKIYLAGSNGRTAIISF